MSSPIQPSGISPTGTTRVSASAAKRSATTTSLGSSSRQPRSRASPIAFRAIAWPLLVLVPRRAHRDAVRDQEREGHGASDQDRVGQLGEAVDDPDLVGHLDAADHHHERPRRAVQQAREGVQLGLQQQSRRRRQLLRDSDRGRVRAVHRPEGVLHEQVGVGGQLGREAGIVGLLAGVEAQVLEHPQLALLVAEGDLAPEQLGQPLRHRPQRQLRLGLPLGPAQMRAHDHLRALVQQQLDGRHGRADAGVVGHVTGVQRHVQVGAHQHAPTGDVQVADAPHAILLMRSTTRQE